MSTTAQIEAQCDDCVGSGVYRGFAETPGIAVVCLKCKGEGKVMLSYTPFSGRKLVEGVRTVRRSAGMVLGSLGATGGSVTYQEFLAGKMP